MPVEASTVLVGRYTGGEPGGIVRATVDHDGLRDLVPCAEVPDASYLAFAQRTSTVYAVLEATGRDGRAGGEVWSLRWDATTGLLQRPRRASTRGDAPCHVAVSGSGALLAVANYRGGVTVHRLAADGSVGEATADVVHTGRGPNPVRQDASHPHMVLFDPATDDLLVPDLGLDRVFRYRVQDGTLDDIGSALHLPAGTGPRHAVFTPAGAALLVLCELSSVIHVAVRDGGGFRWSGVASTLPSSFDGPSTAGAIRLSPSGRWVLTTNRGHDSIAVFEAVESVGVVLRAVVPLHSRDPRDLVFADDGRRVLVAAQTGGEVMLLSFDDDTGALAELDRVGVPGAACVLPL